MQIDGFSEFELIGEGGFATVYKCRQDEFDRRVALKVLNAPLTERTLPRFDRERRALGALSSHPNILTVFGSGITPDGRGFLILEYCPGGAIGGRITQHGPMPWQEVVETLIKLAEALGFAHEQGVLHRDVKPDNILTTQFVEPVLADFGIAWLTDDFRTTTGMVTASLAHAAPEVLEGQPASATSDIYSLVSSAYQMLTGLAPFRRQTDESPTPMIMRILRDPAPSLVPVGVPESICAVLERALAKPTSDRFQSANEFATALRASLDTALRAASISTEETAQSEGTSQPAAGSPSAVLSNTPTERDSVFRTERQGSIQDGSSPAPQTDSDVTVLRQVATPTNRLASVGPGDTSPPAIVTPPAVPTEPLAESTQAATNTDQVSPSQLPTRRKRRKTIATGAGVLAAVVAIAAIVVVDRNEEYVPSKVVATINVSERYGTGRLIAFSDHIYVASGDANYNGTVDVIDPATKKIKTIGVGREVTDFTTYKNRIYVADSMFGAISVIDPTTNTKIKTMKLTYHVNGITTHNNRLYVTDFYNYRVIVIEPSTGKTIKIIKVRKHPGMITTYNNQIYVLSYDRSNSVDVIDPTTNTVTKTIDISGWPLAFTTYNKRLYVAGTLDAKGDGIVSVIDLTTNTKTRTIKVGGDLTGVTAYNDRLYVTSQDKKGEGIVTAIDPTTNTTTASKTIKVGGYLTGITTYNNRLYVTSEDRKGEGIAVVKVIG